jgi:Tfp pilus assembly protein PilE
MKKQSGFAVIELLLIVVALAVIGFTAVTYYNHTQMASNSANQPSPTASVPIAPQIHSTDNLSAADTMISQMDVNANSTDSAQLDTELSNF